MAFKLPVNWLWIGLIIVLIIIVLVKRKIPFLRGWAGERYVKRSLTTLDQNEYKILNNLLLPTRGVLRTTQVDHVVVSRTGIFCIETKAHSGWIFGDARQEHWTRVMFHIKEKFYNPLLQNQTHVCAIEDLIKSKYPQAHVISLVAFTNADKLHITGTNAVGYDNEIVQKIKNYFTPIFTDAERDDVYNILRQANITDKNARKAHNHDVKSIVAQ